MYSKSERIPGILTVQCFVRFSETIIIYRIAGIFRGYKCSWFSLADQAPTANIYTHEFNIACMHACMHARKAAIPPRKPF